MVLSKTYQSKGHALKPETNGRTDGRSGYYGPPFVIKKSKPSKMTKINVSRPWCTKYKYGK